MRPGASEASNATRGIGFSDRRPRQKPVPSFVGVDKNDVDILDSAQRLPARLGAKSKQGALANETIGRVARAMQDDGSLAKEAQRRLHDTILSCGCALRAAERWSAGG